MPVSTLGETHTRGYDTLILMALGLKGYLLSTSGELRRIHDLEALIQDAVATEADFATFLPACQKITEYYTERRYPFVGVSALTEAELRASLAEAEQLLALVRDKIRR